MGHGDPRPAPRGEASSAPWGVSSRVTPRTQSDRNLPIPYGSCEHPSPSLLSPRFRSHCPHSHVVGCADEEADALPYQERFFNI